MKVEGGGHYLRVVNDGAGTVDRLLYTKNVLLVNSLICTCPYCTNQNCSNMEKHYRHQLDGDAFSSCSPKMI